MIDWSNLTASGRQELGLNPEELQKSKCVLGFIPVIYYSILLCVGVPGKQAAMMRSHCQLTSTNLKTNKQDKRVGPNHRSQNLSRQASFH